MRCLKGITDVYTEYCPLKQWNISTVFALSNETFYRMKRTIYSQIASSNFLAII